MFRKRFMVLQHDIIFMLTNNIKGILVGVDDRKCNFEPDFEEGGYCWVIQKKDWDNRSNVATDKIFKHFKQIDDFHIYFYVYKTKSDNPSPDSDKFRNKIFGFADVVKVEKNKFVNNYIHHVKIDNLRLFTPKIDLDEIRDQIEYIDWSEKQIKNFTLPLSGNGLLLTKNDCELFESFKFINSA